jgi:pimeloyl-ACP methyl ester carboxylesterase
MSSQVITTDPTETPIGFGAVDGVPDLPDGFTQRFVSRFVDVDGVRLHVVVGGSGPPILLVGGWPQFWWEWRNVMLPLSEEYSVVAVDPRGVGLSERTEDGYDSQTVAAELTRLMSLLGFDRFDLVGHDVGMWLAYALAADNPPAVSHLAVLEAALPGISDAPSALPDTQKQAEASWHFLFNRLAALNEELVVGRVKAFLSGQFVAKGAHPTSIPEADIDVYVRAQQQPGALHGSFGYYRALDQTIPQNRERAASPLAMPVLAIGGKNSRGDLVGDDVKKVASDVTALTFADCGHYVPEEAPQELVTQLRDFLTGSHPLRELTS